MSFTPFVFASDVHGDMQDPEANEKLFQFVEIWKPKIRIFGGDLWDFRAIRRGASDEEKRESMAADYNAGLNWIKRFKPHVFLTGNHDHRLWALAAANKGVESDYAMQGVIEISTLADKMRFKILPYHHRDGIYRLGNSHLKMLHGFHCGINAARQTALTYGACVFGHVHAIAEHSIPGLEKRIARSAGCLCRLTMDYNQTRTSALAHAHGWCYGVVNEKTGAYHVWQAEEVDGVWVLPTGVTTL